MIAIEIKAPIVNHRIDISSDQLPSNVGQARIIVMFEEASAVPTKQDIVALARAARSSFPKGDPQQLRNEFAALRDDWIDRRQGK
jgi:hypothetical protein